MNCYVLRFHGTPFLASDFWSIHTALNVIGKYDFSIDIIVARLLGLFLAEVVLVLLLFVSDNDVPLRRLHLIPGLFACLGVIWVVFFSSWTPFPGSLISWSWVEPMNRYGYEVCLLNSIHAAPQLYVVPESYSPDSLRNKLSDWKADPGTGSNYPDIILILNESLFDLDIYSDIPEGKTVFAELGDIPGIVSGYATVSMIGGGTNNTEYELLTSNSMAGLSVSAPFNILDLNKAASIVSYLKKLGYESIAMHCEDPANYSRNRAYPSLGFDKVLLGREQFAYSLNGNCPWLDQDNYSDLISQYENMSERPRFVFLLTYQNHGGYEQNPDSFDTVRIEKDLGPLTDEINEYLSSIQLSVRSFRFLIDYYSTVDRPVFIMMAGDHAPSFISDLAGNSQLNEIEKGIIPRLVPYYLWSNTGIDLSSFPRLASMVDLVPSLISTAGMPMSVYYRTIVELNREVSIRTTDGYGIDSSGETILLADNPYCAAILNDYYSMEYNCLLHGKDYIEELYSPPDDA